MDMIDCPNCNIAFSPGYRTCPRCKSFQTPTNDRLNYLQAKARELADKNWTRQEVHAYLLERGLANIEADDMVELQFQSVRSENRSEGRIQLMFGLLLLGLSFFIFGGGIIWIGLILPSLGLIGLGLVRVITGKS